MWLFAGLGQICPYVMEFATDKHNGRFDKGAIWIVKPILAIVVIRAP